MSTAETQQDAPAQQQQQQRRPPAWMSSPGAPQRPDGPAFRSKLTKLVAQRRQYVDEIKALQETIRGNPEEKTELDTERNSLRQRMNEIDAERRSQAQLRSGKNNEIAKIRQQRREASDRLRELQTDLGGMRDVKEIDAAIDYIMEKMETSGGGLAAERKTVKRLHQLEEAKALLLQMQPLAERIQESEEREVQLQQEYREIHERIGVLNKEFDDQLGTKRSKDQEARNTGSNRTEVYKKCDEIRVKIRALEDELNALRTEHDKTTEAWDKWCVEARTKYYAKLEADREARQRAYLEHKNAARNAQKLVRARRRQNPYQLEISACDTLVQYLADKKRMTAVEEDARKRREAAASFDPRKAAPAGTVMLNESEWKSTKPLSKAARKQQEQQKKKQQESKAKTESGNADSAGSKAAAHQHHVLQHPEDKMRLFQLISVDPPLSLAAIDETVKAIQGKKKEYESHIVTGEPQLSSGESEEDEEAEEAEETENKDHHGTEHHTAEEPAAEDAPVAPAADEADGDAPKESE